MLRAVDTDLNAVAARAAAQVKARHASGLRQGTIAAARISASPDLNPTQIVAGDRILPARPSFSA